MLAKMDILSAFRLLILHHSDFELFGFKFKNQFYFDKCLPMGCSASCSLFEKFASFLEWALHSASKKGVVEHYLDDFLLAGKAGTSDCANLMLTFQDNCNRIGVPLAEEKTVGPTPVLVFLGLEIDTQEMVIRIPQDKLNSTRVKLKNIFNKEKVTLNELQSLVGLLNFCAKAIPSVRAFNRRFCDAMCGIKKKSHFIRVTHNMKEDIRMWLIFLDKFNGTCHFGRDLWISNKELDLFPDSAGSKNLGVVFILQINGHFFHGQNHGKMMR